MKKTISIICMIALSAGTVMQAQSQDNDRREKISIGGRAAMLFTPGPASLPVNNVS